MHPLINDLSQFKDLEIESKINELSRKYFMTKNVQLQSQIGLVLDTYRNEMNNRKQAEWERLQENRDKDLDKLINVD
jgi:hypothetical protein